MKLKSIMAISASILLVGANLFVISAKQGNVNCKSLLSKTLSFNHFAFANDAGYNFGSSTYGNAKPNGIADCSSLRVETFHIDVKLDSQAGLKLKSYADGNLNLSAQGVPYVSGGVSISAGTSSDNSSNDSSDSKIIGDMFFDVRTARPQYVYCDYQNYNTCIDHADPCNELKNACRKEALSVFGL